MGLARGNSNFKLSEDGEDAINIDTTQSYVTAMKKADLIKTETISFYFNNLDASYADFGQYQETSINGEIKYVTAHDDFFWSLDNTAVAFGDSPDDKAKKFESPVYTIIDTSQPTLSIAAEYFDAYVEAIFSMVSGSDYQVEQG